MREDSKSFQALVVSQALIEYTLHQVHGVLGHNGTARTYQSISEMTVLLEMPVERC